MTDLDGARDETQSAWLRDLDRVLCRGATDADLEVLEGLLGVAPDGWAKMPRAPRVPAPGVFPVSAQIWTNPNTDWAHRAVRLLERAGPPLLSMNPWPTAPPLVFALLSRLDALNWETYVRALDRIPGLAGDAEGRVEWGVRWFSHLFDEDTPQNATTTRRQVQDRLIEAVFAKIPELRTGTPAQRLWIRGLGAAGTQPGPSVLRSAAMRGLDGTVLLERDHAPPIALEQWEDLAQCDWILAPAWAWATHCDTFLGNRLLLQEILASQPAPWDPNARLPDGSRTVGQWLLVQAAARRPADIVNRAMELQVLGLDWLAGDPGRRPIDLMRVQGKALAVEALGSALWGRLTALDQAGSLDASLPSPSPPVAPRARL